VPEEEIASPPSVAARNDTTGHFFTYRLKDYYGSPRKFKETGREFDDSAVLPGQMEMTLTMV